MPRYCTTIWNKTQVARESILWYNIFGFCSSIDTVWERNKKMKIYLKTTLDKDFAEYELMPPDMASCTGEFLLGCPAPSWLPDSEGKLIKDVLPYRVLATRMDNRTHSLRHHLKEGCRLELLDMTDPAANLMYQHSLCLLYLKAVMDVLGEDADVDIPNALNKGLFTRVKDDENISDEKVAAIEKRMRELVEKDVPIVRESLLRNDAVRLFMEWGDEQKAKLLMADEKQAICTLYSIEGYRNFFYSLMVPSTGYLEYFELRRYRNGILLRFPHTSKPDEIPPYVDEVKLYQAFGEATRWGYLTGVTHASDLNDMVSDGSYKELIQISEALHEKKIAEIADMIKKEKKRIVLIAGPSSSGKTSFAKRLCVQLRVNGLKPLYMGTDDYFLDRADTPKDEDGNYDFENLNAMDIPLFNHDMNALLAGETVDLPTFDFVEGKKIFGQRKTKISSNQPIVIEGIHALNEAMTPGIKKEDKFKIYISPLTQLNIDDHNRIPTTDMRMLRRMVRDNNFRGREASVTIRDWPKVRRGEDKNIFPYSNEADVFFNSVHIYELAVLKKYAEPLLESVRHDEPEYSEAVRMLRYLRFFKTIKDDSVIVNNSIIREFIGGSILV